MKFCKDISPYKESFWHKALFKTDLGDPEFPH